MQILVNWILATLVVLVAAYIAPGVVISSFAVALLTAAVIGIINAVIRPVVFAVFFSLSLPINIFTLVFSTLLLNALLLMLAAAVVPGFIIRSFWWALVFGFLLWFINVIVNSLFTRSAK